jgi:hypothetical protein
MGRRRSGSLELRRSGWCARVTLPTADDAGERVRVELGTFDRKRAERMLSILLQEAEQGSRLHAAKAKAVKEETFAVYSAAWLERRFAAKVVMAPEERGNLKHHILPQLGPMPLGAIRAVHIRAVLSKAAEKLSRETVRKLRGLMNRILGAAFREELIAENPVSRAEVPTDVRADTRERAILTDAEVHSFLLSPLVDLELKVLSVCARVLGGLRSSELNRWAWTMLDRQKFADVTIRRAKAKRGIPGKVQRLVVPEPMRPILRLWWETQGMPDGGPVFPVRRGKRKGGFKVRSAYARRLRKALLRAAVDRSELHQDTELTRKADFHSFRRAFSTALAVAGVNLQTAMALSAHSSIGVHARYLMGQGALREVPLAAVPALPDVVQLAQAGPNSLPESD